MSKHSFNVQFGEYTESSKKHYSREDEKGVFRTVPLMASGRTSGVSGQPWRGVDVSSRGKNGMHWLKSPEILESLDREGKILWNKQGIPELKYYVSEAKGVYVSDFWDDIPVINSMARESVGYATQKPEKLIERIISASSNPGDIVADFFVGSGTTCAVAEKLGRKWIGSDLGKFGIHTSRKRLIDVQRQLKEENKSYRAFEVLNLGRYERSYFVGGNENLDESQISIQAKNKELAFDRLILNAYHADKVDGFRTFRGKKNNRLVAIGPVDLPLSRGFAEEVISECVEKNITKADILAFEFEMGLFPNIQDEGKQKGVDIVLKYIPKDVFDKRAVENNEVAFHDVAFIEVKPHFKKNTIAVELLNYSVFYTQGSLTATEQNLKDGKSAVVVDNGQVLKVSKDKDGLVSRTPLTKKWSDWVDYWSVDFDFESKKELIKTKNEETGEFDEKWTGDYIFENEWQSFRTRQDRTLELKSVFFECSPGKRKVAVKVIDIFGNDTMKVIPVTIEGK